MRFARAIALLFGGLTLALCGAVIIPRGQPGQVAIPEIARCDGTPCFLGILPARTKLETAHEILKSTSEFVFADYSARTAYKVVEPYDQVELIPGAEDLSDTGTIYAVELVFFDNSKVTAGDIVLQIGEPCAVYYTGATAPGIIMRYPGAVVMVTHDTQNHPQLLGQDSSVTRFNLFQDVGTCEALTGKYKGDQPWHGFTTYQGYAPPTP